MFEKIKLIHFVGIGGIGMSGLALILKNMGYKVSGSDIAKTTLTEYLKKQGIKIFYTHRPANCRKASVVVYSSAVSPNNPEIRYAHLKKIPVIQRAEMLAELMRMKYSVAISGTHGKTTVTSMIGTILEYAGLKPTVIIGGKVMGMDSGAKLGTGPYLVTEADESDRSFLHLYPIIALITNIEREHLDFYKNLKEIKKAFVEFANKVPFYGSAILCIDCPNVRSILPQIKRNYITYGIKYPAQVKATDIHLGNFYSDFTVKYNHKKLPIHLNVPGLHNIQNALGAIGTAIKFEISPTIIKEALANFRGVHRRLEKKGMKNGIVFFDDYAHHPTEIKATLKTLRHAYPNQRIIVIFQPHRYTRTLKLGKYFGNAFKDADMVIITKIYSAQEKPIPNVSANIIMWAIEEYNKYTRKPIMVVYKNTFSQIIDYLTKILKNGDILITIGAGNIWQVGEELLRKI
jgi:UDP-N-acetylmuramate--alanine ligase